MVKEGGKRERIVRSFGMCRMVRWSSRLAVTAYSQLGTRKGRLAAWRHKIGRHDTGLCCRCFFFFFFFKSRNPACSLVPWQEGVITPTR